MDKTGPRKNPCRKHQSDRDGGGVGFPLVPLSKKSTLRFLWAVVLFSTPAGCGRIYKDPVQAVSIGFTAEKSGGTGDGIAAGISSVFGEGASGVSLGVEAGVGEDCSGNPACSIGVSAWTGPDLFYLLAASTAPEYMYYASPCIGLGTGLFVADEPGWYGELKAGMCFYVPEFLRVRAGWVWGWGTEGGYDGWRADLEFIF